jgi:GT2 family glycosyltransferase
MKSAPLVSAIYCNYNHGKYLEQCFEGLLRQNYTNFELLITDDGSTDNSRSIIERYAAADERIKPVFFEKNQGIAAAHNASLVRAHGDYLYMGACDDFVISEDFFGDAVAALELRPEVPLFYGICGIYQAETQKLISKMGMTELEGYNTPEQCARGFLRHRSMIPGTSCIFRRATYLKGGGDNMAEFLPLLGPQVDYCLTHRLAFNAGAIYSAKPYACFRVFAAQSNFSARPNLWRYMERLNQTEIMLRATGMNYPEIEADWEFWRAANVLNTIRDSGIIRC